MKTLAIVLSLFVSLTAAASPSGPSVSGGVPQAPWVRNQSIIGQVLEYLNENNIGVKGIEVVNHSQQASVTTLCSGQKTSRLIFDVKSSCFQTAVMCIPEVAVVLNRAQSKPCTY